MKDEKGQIFNGIQAPNDAHRFLMRFPKAPRCLTPFDFNYFNFILYRLNPGPKHRDK